MATPLCGGRVREEQQGEQGDGPWRGGKTGGWAGDRSPGANARAVAGLEAGIGTPYFCATNAEEVSG